MNTHEFSLSVDGAVLKGTAWLPEHPVATLLIEHGMAEHHKRYADFAAHLVTQGIAVYSYDKRGHGLTAGSPGSEEWKQHAGWFAKSHGFQVVISDSLDMLRYIRTGGVTGNGRAKAGPGGGLGNFDPSGQGHLPLYLMGHSFGSFVVRSVVADPRAAALKLSGVIISGTAGPAGAIGAVGKMMAILLSGLRGPLRASPFMDKLATGNYAGLATGEKLPRTSLDWLSRDNAVVDAYKADPYCGFVMSASFYRDMIGGLAGLFSADYTRRFPRDLPVLMFSGDHDPVGSMGTGVSSVHEAYKSWGVKDLSFTLFPGGRHEMLNETNRQEVYNLVSDWLKARTK